MENNTHTLNILYSHRTRGKDVERVHIKGISDAFIQMGHSVTFVSIPGVDINRIEESSTPNGKQPGFWTHVSKYCPQLVFEAMELLYNIVLYRNIKQVLEKQKIDFIYERYALNTFATTLLGKRFGVPVIQEINDASGIQRVRQHKLENLAKYIESWVFHNSSLLITISSEFEKILIERGYPREKISFRPNAIDPIKFNPIDVNDNVRKRLNLDGKVVVGFVGSFALWHSVEFILGIAPDLIKTIPNIHFLMVGSGIQLQNVQDKVNKMGLSSKFTFPGKVNFDDVPCYLKAMDVGIIPNSNQYGSPMKLFEYMAMGVVPVVPNLPPITDVIEHGMTGLLFQCGDAEDMKKQIQKVVSDETFRKKLSSNARKKVIEDHLWVHNASHIIKEYERIIDQAHSR